jgi:hypothetical protein
MPNYDYRKGKTPRLLLDSNGESVDGVRRQKRFEFTKEHDQFTGEVLNSDATEDIPDPQLSFYSSTAGQYTIGPLNNIKIVRISALTTAGGTFGVSGIYVRFGTSDTDVAVGLGSATTDGYLFQ